jgi:hypothetical protein
VRFFPYGGLVLIQEQSVQMRAAMHSIQDADSHYILTTKSPAVVSTDRFTVLEAVGANPIFLVVQLKQL